jgi:hypothetical protein
MALIQTAELATSSVQPTAGARAPHPFRYRRRRSQGMARWSGPHAAKVCAFTRQGWRLRNRWREYCMQ